MNEFTSNLASEEKAFPVADWNSTAAEYPRTKCLHHLFEERVEENPDSIALRFREETVSYRELNERANRLAGQLQALNLPPETLIGIFMERSIEMVVGLLAILKTGAAYVPLDPEFPAERLAHMISDAAMPVILTQQKLVNTLPSSSAKIVAIDRADDALESVGKISANVSSKSVAYVIYTSGSTGKPKGVQITHRSVINLLLSIQRLTGVTAQDRFLAVSTYSFDISVLEIFLPLITGGQVILAQREIVIDGAQLGALIKSSGATFLQATPATWRLLIQTGWKGGDQLTIFSGGEALDRHLADELLKRVKAVWNLYGPTETTIYSIGEKVAFNTEPILIGRPVANTQTYILDENREQVAIGEVGELHIGGDGLARGYLHRPELTEEKFISNPFAPERSPRLYKTGDLARFLPDGRIQCLGRIDHQVKIRGYRIELGEIENVLRQFSGIQQAVVVAREETLGNKRLVAYLRTGDASLPPVPRLREFLQTNLPDYMIPVAYVLQEKFPLTPTGKIDRAALPEPAPEDRPLNDTYVAPETPLETDVAAIWSEVFHVNRVGMDDNFFALGGHSLTALQILVRIREKTGVELPVSIIFETASLRHLVEALLEKLLANEDNDELGAVLKNLNEMSDEEANELLRSDLRDGSIQKIPQSVRAPY